MNNKICLIAHLNDLSGANKALIDLASGLNNTFKITVVVPRRGPLKEELDKRKIRTKVIPSATWVYKKNEILVKKVVKYLINMLAEIEFWIFFRKEKFELIHFNSMTYGCGAKAAKKLKIPYIWHIRELPEENFGLSFFDKKKAYHLISQSKIIITISDFMMVKVKSTFPNNIIKKVYDGTIIKDENKITFRRPSRLVLIGAVAPDKGQDDAIKALKILHEKYSFDISLCFVGKVTNQEYYETIRTEIGPEVNKKIKFIGYMKDVSKFRDTSYLALVCSKREAFGLVTVEAMNAGQIVIGANGGATSEIIIDGIDGFLYEPGNYEELAGLIYNVINSRNDLIKIEKCAHENASKRFDIQTTISKMASIFEELLGDNL